MKKGTIHLTAGEIKVFVPCEVSPSESIGFDVSDEDYSTCGHLKGNSFKIVKTHDGFNLIAKVESNSAKFHWFVQ